MYTIPFNGESMIRSDEYLTKAGPDKDGRGGGYARLLLAPIQALP